MATSLEIRPKNSFKQQYCYLAENFQGPCSLFSNYQSKIRILKKRRCWLQFCVEFFLCVCENTVKVPNKIFVQILEVAYFEL